MCLYTKSRIFYIAKKDIICYKVCIKEDNINYSLYRKYPYNLDTIVKSKISITEATCNQYNYYIEKGLHTFKYLKDARFFIEKIKKECYNLIGESVSDEVDKITILRCIIPKNSIYIEGLDIGDGLDIISYVSDKLLPVKEIK